MMRRALALALSVLSWALPAHAVQRSILNPSFETPTITGACYAFVSESLTGGWRTTETNTTSNGACGVPTGGTGGVLEYWGNGFNGVVSDNGANHIELNAYNPARVSQSVCMVAGDQVNWQFSHRARDVGLGPGSRDVALFSVDSSANSVRTANTSAAGGTGGSCPASSGGVTGNSCSASTVGTWGRYSGSFTWAGSSGTHDIGFEAISNSTNTPGAGNFLDNIQFTLKPMVEFDSASASTYVVAESAGTVTLRLRVAGIVPAGGVQVPFTVSGTATSGSDYTAFGTASITVPAGNYGAGTVVNASPTLALLDDTVLEDTETVIITLGASTPASPYVLSSTSSCGGAAVATATVFILDNDVNITLTKAIVGVPADGGKFNLQISGGAPSGGTNPANDIGHGGTTGAVRVATGATVTLAETAGTGTLLSNYSTALACTDGNGAAVAVSGSGTSRTVTTPVTGTTTATAPTAAARTLSCTYTNTYAPPYPRLQIAKTTVGGSGSNVFGFALSGLSASTDTITVVGAGTASGSATLVGTAGLEASIKETVPTGWPANPASASCVDSASATPTVAFGTLVANQLTIPAANMVAGANITCTFTNHFGFSVRGRVFNDNGVGAGTANDGLLNGGEAGIAGVAVRLTNCAATVLASAVTDGAGRYALAVPFATATGAPLCVEETNPATPSAWTSTGASAGGTALPSGTATTVAGSAYTYTRGGTPDRIAFAWNGSGAASLDFGDVAPNTFAADGAKTGLPGSTVSYPHTFKAQTGGVVRFGIAGEVATPTLAGWSGKIFADSACTGALQTGAVLLYPPSVPVMVVAGQSVCLVMQEFVPATAMNGHSNDATVQASFDFSNAGPALGASYTVHDITTVSDSVLELKKEVRNVTQGGAFGINNQAKSGETLEYRITYTNNGVSPIGTLSINDTTPSYTSFVGAQASSTPATLTACQKTTPANPVPAPTVACAAAQAGGGKGALSWHFTGVLSPGASGAVLFSVKVD